MDKKYYSSGEFARLSGVTQRTVRYYDKINILKPSYVTPSGARYYTRDDLAGLQQILFLKYLGLSLDEIREIAVADPDNKYMLQTLNIQKKLLEDRIEKMQQVSATIDNMLETLQNTEKLDWNEMLELIHLTGNDRGYREQFMDSANLSSRIALHRDYSQNPVSWFKWIFNQLELRPGLRILELGCGDGSLWKENMNSLNLIPGNIRIVLTDPSEGMLRDARREIGLHGGRFAYGNTECEKIPYPNESFDLVIANHVLFYCDNINAALKEIKRVLKPGGRFICSTYGALHMKEIGELVTEFDPDIRLSEQELYRKFGKENGSVILSDYFIDVLWQQYEDHLLVKDAEPLISYILSCHGNQGKYISGKYEEFRQFIISHMRPYFYITKDSGIFICRCKKTAS